MDNKQIQAVLEEAFKKEFLEQIEFIFDNERLYKQGAFFKKTKIPLITLYEKYYLTQSKERLSQDIIDIIMNFDTEYLIIKLEQFFEGLEDSEKIEEILDRIMAFFGTAELSDYKEKITEVMKKLKITK